MLTDRVCDFLEEGIIAYNKTMDIVYCNKSIREHINVEAQGYQLSDLTCDEDIKAIERCETGDRVIVHFLEKTGQVIPVECCFMEEVYLGECVGVLMVHKNSLDKFTQQEMIKILDSLPYAIWIEDYEKKYVFFNQTAYFVINSFTNKKYTKDEIYQLTGDKIWGSVRKSQMWKDDNKVLKNGEIIYEERSFNYKSSQYKYYLSKWPIRNDSGEVEKVLCAVEMRSADNEDNREVFQQLMINQELARRSKKNMGFTLQLLTEMLEVVGIYIYTYSKLEEKMQIFKDSKEECDGTESLESMYVPWERYCKFIDHEGKLTVQELEELLQCKISSTWKEKDTEFIQKYSINYGNEQVACLILLFKDETMAKLNYEQIIQEFTLSIALMIKNAELNEKVNKESVRRRGTEEELKNYLSVAIDFLLVVDDDGKIIKISQEYQSILGWQADEIINKHLVEFIIPNEENDIEEISLQLKKSGKVEKGEQCCKTNNGNCKWLEWRGKYVAEKNIYFIAFRDVTLDRQKEKERRKYKEALQIETLKNEFISNISHELKTPLNIIYSMLQLTELEVKTVDKKEKSEIVDLQKLRRYRKVSKQNVYRLLRLINNIMDVTNVDAGAYELNLVNCNIINVVEEITMSVVEYVRNKDVDITFDTEEEEVIMACDMDKMERILLNLLSNAVKYTPAGGNIFVNMKVRDENLIVEVSDTGIGIPRDKQKMIFERFTQVDTLFTRKCEGSGIGLALVKSFTQMLKGRVEVESEEGKGSTFRVILPIVKAPEKQLVTYDKDKQRILKCHVEFSDIYEL